MSERAPIPADEFAAAIDRLDRDALARFVARLEAAAADDATVDVDPPIVTVRAGDVRRTIVIAPDGDGAIEPAPTGAEVDSVVVGASAPDRPGGDEEPAVRTPADLRRQLLYALPPDAAESIAAEWLGGPARAPAYAPDEADAPDDPVGRVAGGTPEPSASGSGSAPTGEPRPPGARARGDVSGESTAPADRDESGPITDPGGTRPPRRIDAQVAVAGVVVAVLLVATGGVMYAAALSPDGDAGAFAVPADGAVAAPVADDDGLSEAAVRNRSRGPVDHGGPIETAATPTPGGGVTAGEGPRSGVADAATRNARPAPTCERSSLLVVQIQMNALRYNDDATDDGIRTVRRFASPRNRQTIETFDEFVRTIRSPTYSPMLSYDSVRYTPIQESDDYAQVQVLTRENDTVTGQYYFRLRNVDGGEYDGCWMTDAVVATPQTVNASGQGVAHPEGRPAAS